MNRLERVCLELNTIVDTAIDVNVQGMDRRSAETVISMEGADALPYPMNAYSKRPSVTFRKASLESIGRIILEKIASGIDLVIDVISRIFKYVVNFITGDYKKHYKEQKKHYEYASKHYSKSLSEFRKKENNQRKQEAEDVLLRNATEELTNTAERLNSTYNLLVKTIHLESREFSKVLVEQKNVEIINTSTRDVIKHVNNALTRFGEGKMHSLTELTLQGHAKQSMTRFLTTCATINSEIASTRLKTIQMPAFNNTEEDLLKPHLYMRKCIEVIREASNTESGNDYIRDYLDMGKSAVPEVDNLGDHIEFLFEKDDIFKFHKEFERAKKDLLKAKRDLNRKGVMPDEMEYFREAMLEYITTVTATVNYSILFRQVNKVTLRAILRFMNANTAYMTARMNIMNRT